MYKKCPRCELNWIKDQEEYCSVCIEELSNNKIKTPTQTEIRAALVKIEDIVGKTYQLDTHAKFLNKVFGTNYIDWMQSTWNYSPNILVWMVRFYGITGDWKNRYDGNKITEEYVGTTGLWNGKPITEPDEDYKIAVSINNVNILATTNNTNSFIS